MTLIFSVQCIIKQLLDLIFVISRIFAISVRVRVKGKGYQPQPSASLAKSLQLILGNSATYRLFTNLYLQISE